MAPFNLFIVDNADSIRALLESAFKNCYQVESFASAEDCLARLNEPGCTPNFFLLDVDLPGMDGYSLCRQIKKRPDLAHTPVIFISSLDDLESRLDGYGAGGIDYVVKPFHLPEVKQKVAAARLLIARETSLTQRIIESETLTSLILSNLDEYATLVKFLRALNDCDNLQNLLDLMFEMLRAYGLNSAIQIRLNGLEMTVSADGKDRPLEVSVINHVRTMDRIFEFKSRAAYNFEHITLLINNMPLHDPDLCGRLRDHLAIATESANAKVIYLQTRTEYTLAKDIAADLLTELQVIVMEFGKKHAGARYRGSMLTQDMLNELARAFASLGLSDEQELGIDGIVQKKCEDLATVYDFSMATQEALHEISARLGQILQPAMSTASDENAVQVSETNAAAAAAIEIF